MRPRVQRAPGLPCALYFLGRTNFAKLGRIVSREGGSMLVMPEQAGIQYSETLVMELRTRGVLDTRLPGCVKTPTSDFRVKSLSRISLIGKESSDADS